jgi:two-component system, OmpR family, response regulator
MSLDLLLVESDAALAATLAAELGGFGYRVTVASDGPQALAAILRTPFEAILLERMLPMADGLAVLQQIRREGITAPVIILTTLGRLAEKVEGLEAGADDYLVKPVDPVELNARIHAVRRSRTWAKADTDTVRAGEIVVSPGSHRAWHGGKPVDLSKVELGLLAELARNAGAVVTRATLYERLWGDGFAPSTNIAEAHIRRLRQKLTAGGRADPILTVRGVGYKLKA